MLPVNILDRTMVCVLVAADIDNTAAETNLLRHQLAAMGRALTVVTDLWSAALTTAADMNVVMPTAQYICDRIDDVFLAKDESRLPDDRSE